ncbi:hypothetical protein X975_09297, partial [Stegodyphus mimosarum]
MCDFLHHWTMGEKQSSHPCDNLSPIYCKQNYSKIKQMVKGIGIRWALLLSSARLNFYKFQMHTRPFQFLNKGFNIAFCFLRLRITHAANYLFFPSLKVG